MNWPFDSLVGTTISSLAGRSTLILPITILTLSECGGREGFGGMGRKHTYW